VKVDLSDKTAMVPAAATGSPSPEAQAKDYVSVLAPFDGVVTRRNIDVGNLVQADATSGTFMFTVCRRARNEIVVLFPEVTSVHIAGPRSPVRP
jgi:multidrug resistance efflux pump